MATQTRASWDPWSERQRLQRELQQFFGAGAALRWPLTGEYPPLNVSRVGDGVVIEALCPGIDRAALDVTIVGESLAISGERQPPPDVPEDRYRRRERPAGSFARTVNLGERFDPDRTQATYADGILRLTLVRAPEASPKKIQIQS